MEVEFGNFSTTKASKIGSKGRFYLIPKHVSHDFSGFDGAIKQLSMAEEKLQNSRLSQGLNEYTPKTALSSAYTVVHEELT